jgi:hypothetical protein
MIDPHHTTRPNPPFWNCPKTLVLEFHFPGASIVRARGGEKVRETLTREKWGLFDFIIIVIERKFPSVLVLSCVVCVL